MVKNNSNKILPEWFVVVNPNAGSRKIKKDWPVIKQLLNEKKLSYFFRFTEGPLHAIEITSDAIKKGYRKFIAVGGDGTMNEVVNAIFTQNEIPPLDFQIGIIPVGTGNDWGRMFKIPGKYEDAINILKQNDLFIQDIGKINYYDGDRPKQRFFVNVAGTGFDALVAKKTNIQKQEGKSSFLSYFYNLLISLFQYKPKIAEVDVDGNKNKYNIFSMSIGICRYNGGGMMQLPNALPDDGLLDATIIKKIGLGTIFWQLKNLYTGTFIKHPKVVTLRGKEIKIKSRKIKFFLEADGETLGHSPFEITILPGALQVIIGDRDARPCVYTTITTRNSNGKINI